MANVDKGEVDSVYHVVASNTENGCNPLEAMNRLRSFDSGIPFLGIYS